MPASEQCKTCNAAIDRRDGSTRSRQYFVCAMHPSGPDCDPCPDYEPAADNSIFGGTVMYSPSPLLEYITITPAIEDELQSYPLAISAELRQIVNEQARLIAQIAAMVPASQSEVFDALQRSQMEPSLACQMLTAGSLEWRDGGFHACEPSSTSAAEAAGMLRPTVRDRISKVLRDIFNAI